MPPAVNRGKYADGTDRRTDRRQTAPPYLSDYCVPAAGANTRQHLRSANRQLLAVPRYRLNTYVGPFQLPAPQSGTLSRISSGT